MNNIVIATSTFYPAKKDKIRIALSKKTFQKARSLGYLIVAVDGGSPKTLTSEYEKLGARVFCQEKPGMGNGRRQAISLATEMSNNIVVWMEPEKAPFVSQIESLSSLLEKQAAGIVIPKRKSLSSYPFVQQQTEMLGNLFWKELTQSDLDVYFGPRVWKKEISEYFLKYNGEYGDLWDSTFIPIMNAIAEGKKVISGEIDYKHPPEQAEQEKNNLPFWEKRFEQLDKLSTNIHQHWNKLLRMSTI